MSYDALSDDEIRELKRTVSERSGEKTGFHWSLARFDQEEVEEVVQAVQDRIDRQGGGATEFYKDYLGISGIDGHTLSFILAALVDEDHDYSVEIERVSNSSRQRYRATVTEEGAE